MIDLDILYCMDIFELCEKVPKETCQMILVDLPYGTTSHPWDEIIPFAPMWEQFRRIIKPNGAIVLTASMPFTAKLVMSALDIFRYEMIWEKSNATGFLDAKRRPMKKHESILVFGLHEPDYYPIMEVGDPYVAKRHGHASYLQDKTLERMPTFNEGTRYPKSVLHISDSQDGKIHPTQKPEKLFRYLTRTYTRPNDVVFDPCCGSGTTAVSARIEGRRFICGDNSPTYVELAQKRLNLPYTAMFPELVNDLE